METPHPPAADSRLHFLDYWRIVRIRKTVILAVFLLVVLTTTAVTYVLPQTFSSTARMRVEKDATDVPSFFSQQTSSQYDPFFLTTEFEVIQSQVVLYNVITNLNLRDTWGKRYQIEGGRYLLPEAFQILRRKLDVRQWRNTSIIEIRAYSEEKDEAANLANKVAESYRKFRLSQVREASGRGISKYKEQYQSQETKVAQLRRELDDLRVQVGISDFQADGGQPGTVLEPETTRKLDNEVISAESSHSQLKTMLTELANLPQSELRAAMAVAYQNDADLTDLILKLNASEQEKTRLLQDRTEETPEVQRVTSLIKTINEQIEKKLKGILAGLAVKVASLKSQMDVAQQRLDKAKKTEVENARTYRPYWTKKRDLETEQRMLEALKMQIQKEEIEKELPRLSMVEIIDRAEPPTRPVRPNIPLNIVLGVIVGLVVGLGLAFFIEYLDTSVKTIDEIERALQAPVLGVIPQNVGFLIEEGPDSPHAEAYRVLRTNLLFSRKKPELNTLTIISGGAAEGKSTTIFNLATIFAQGGQRVLIVDSDLRRPSLHKFLRVSNSIGLTNYLLRQKTLEEVIQTTRLPTLDFLPSGKLPSSAMGILNSPRMHDFIQEVSRRYEFVFFDSPPIMGVSDASVLASQVSMALLVVQYRKYPQALTVRAKQMIEKVGGNLMGVVINNINISQDSYYYYYSGYYYDYYSKHEDGDEAKTPAAGGAADAKIAGVTPAKPAGNEPAKLEIKSKF